MSKTVIRRLIATISAILMAVTLAPVSQALAQSTPEIRQIASACAAPCSVVSGPNETVEVLLPDATSVILAPNSRAVIARGADGQLVITVQRGLVRVAGGTRNATVPIGITTPHATLSLEDGAAIVVVGVNGTRSHLLNGAALRVSSGGETERIYRPGFQVIATGSGTTAPRRMSTEAVTADILALSLSLTTGIRPRVTSGAAGTAPAGGSVDEGGDIILAQETPTAPDPLPNDVTPTEPGPTAATFESPVGVDLADAFGTTQGGSAESSAERSSSTAFGFNYTGLGDYRSILLDDEFCCDPDFIEEANVRTSVGPITNRIVDGDDLADYAWTSLGQPNRFVGPGGNIQHVWFDSSDSFYGHFGYTSPGQWDARGFGSGIGGSFFFGRDTLAYESLISSNARTFTASSFRYGDGTDEGIVAANSPFSATTEILTENAGATVRGIAAGAGPAANTGSFSDVVVQDADNFLLSEISPALAGESRFLDSVAPLFVGTDVCNTDRACVEASFAIEDKTYDELITFVETNALEDLYGGDFAFAQFTESIQVITNTGGDIVLLPVEDFNDFAELNLGDLLATLYPGRQIDFDIYNPFLDPQPSVAIVIENLDPDFRVVIASGDLDGLYDADNTSGAYSVAPGAIDRFHLAGSLQGGLGDLSTGVGGVTIGMDHATGRAFLRQNTWTDLALATDVSQLQDSGIILRYPNAPVIDGDGGTDAVLLHADFGFVALGDAQASTMSTTIGALDYRLSATGEVDGLMSARTIGSSAESGDSSTIFVSDYHSSATGGGNHRLAPADGRLGFFVLENNGQLLDDFDQSEGADNFQTELFGGTERRITDSVTDDFSQFTALRIGVGVATDTTAPTLSFDSRVERIGFATGFVETAGADGVELARLRPPYPGVGSAQVSQNLTFSNFDTDAHTFEAMLTVGEQTLTFGGAGASALVAANEFGALSTSEGANLALVSGEVGTGSGDALSDSLAGQFRNAEDTANVAVPTSSLHTQWGFFFGDLRIGESRAHVHAGTWASGDRLSVDATAEMDRVFADYDPDVHRDTVTRVYSGHAIGNVSESGNTRLVVGTYQDSFNFGTRTGAFEMDFDDRIYGGISEAANRSAGPGLLYTGTSQAPDGSITSRNPDITPVDNFVATVAGEFVSNGGSLAGGLPGGLVGSFDIGGPGYAATGTIGATGGLD